jgi:hypothetical protein
MLESYFLKLRIKRQKKLNITNLFLPLFLNITTEKALQQAMSKKCIR